MQRGGREDNCPEVNWCRAKSFGFALAELGGRGEWVQPEGCDAKTPDFAGRRRSAGIGSGSRSSALSHPVVSERCEADSTRTFGRPPFGLWAPPSGSVRFSCRLGMHPNASACAARVRAPAHARSWGRRAAPVTLACRLARERRSASSRASARAWRPRSRGAARGGGGRRAAPCCGTADRPSVDTRCRSSGDARSHIIFRLCFLGDGWGWQAVRQQRVRQQGALLTELAFTFLSTTLPFDERPRARRA